MVKFGLAFAGLLSGLIFSFIGFTPNAPTQPEGAVLGVRIFYTFLPMAGTLIAMWVMRNYSLTEERAKDIRNQLEERKGVELVEG